MRPLTDAEIEMLPAYVTRCGSLPRATTGGACRLPIGHASLHSDGRGTQWGQSSDYPFHEWSDGQTMRIQEGASSACGICSPTLALANGPLTYGCTRCEFVCGSEDALQQHVLINHHGFEHRADTPPPQGLGAWLPTNPIVFGTNRDVAKCDICGRSSGRCAPSMGRWAGFMFPVGGAAAEHQEFCPPCAEKVAKFIAHLSTPMVGDEDLL